MILNILFTEADDLFVYIDKNKRKRLSFDQDGCLAESKNLLKETVRLIEIGKEKIGYNETSGWEKISE